MNEPNAGACQVVAAALVRDDGRVLIMQRLPGTHMAGRWEFPGGKVEHGEAARAALDRELAEELGVVPTDARPLIRIRHEYPQRSVLLDCWRVGRWDGEVSGLEGHPLDWVPPAALPDRDLLEADRPMVTALRLPPRYAITPDLPPAGLLGWISRAADRGHMLLQLRARSLAAPEFRAVAADAIALSRLRGVTLLLNTSVETAAALDADGVHLNAARVALLRDRPLPPSCLIGASCHDAIELARARAAGCDFAVLGPVAPTRSHPRREAMGWRGFGALADCAGLPVYALGGLGDDDVATAWENHGQGVAGISAWA